MIIGLTLFVILIWVIYYYEPSFDFVNGGILMWYNKRNNNNNLVERDFKWIYSKHK